MTEEERERARERTRLWRQQPGNREREIAAKRARREADPERWAAQRKAASARYAERNRGAVRVAASEVRAVLRTAALEAYGGRCACPGCHVHHIELLTIDHIAGDGAEHRRRLGRSTRDFYRWLAKNNYPDGFQALCGSCNLAKANRATCPLAGQEH